MAKHKSIKARLHSARSLETRAEVLSDWLNNWHDDQKSILRLLETGITSQDMTTVIQATKQLKVITDKRFVGLKTVLSKLQDGQNDA